VDENRSAGGRQTAGEVAIVAELRIPLADAIRALRRELVEAVRQGKDEELRFRLGPIELELQLEISREAGGEAGISFWIVSIGAKGSRTSATTHTVKLTLAPVGDVVVHDEIPGEIE
jgi:Trypsin-co-occurring domain 2